MSRSFITNMRHFSDERGEIPESTSKKARKFINHIGTIIAYATVKPGVSPKTVVVCWNRINSKLCSGKIDAGIDLGSSYILWHCLKCGDHGSVSNWRNTLWDNSSG